MKYSFKGMQFSTLTFLIYMCSFIQMSYAANNHPLINNLKGTEAHPVALENSIAWLIADNKNGLTWVKEELGSESKVQFKGRIATMDWRFLNKNETHILIAAIDSETSAIHLLAFDIASERFSTLHSFKPERADTEALCLGNVDDSHSLYYVNALGQAKHLIISFDETNGSASLVPVRTLNVGENIKDCAISDRGETLFLVEEEIGIWQYDARAEGQLERSLIPFETNIEVQSISAISDQQLVVVSPDTNKVLIYSNAYKGSDKSHQSAVRHIYPTSDAFDTVNVALLEKDNKTQLLLGVYSEASDKLSALQFDLATQNPKGEKDEVKKREASNIARFLPRSETKAVQRFGDAADDPAIWVNSRAPSSSLIYGTDKKSGLNIYSLSGDLVQSIGVGRINNIDIRKNVMINGAPSDIAVASNRTYQSMTVFQISPITGKATYLGDIQTDLDDVYGICLYQQNDKVDVIINDTSGTFNRYRLNLSDTTNLIATKTFSFKTASQPEGCVADDGSARLFYGEESTGVWLRSLNNDNDMPQLIAKAEYPVQADIEGMGIYKLNNESFLVVSSQGNNRFAVYRIDADNQLLGVFEIGLNEKWGIDAVSETDGLEVTSINLGDYFPHGLLVVQDGHNVMPLEPQNFKIISGEYLQDFILESLEAKK